MTSFGGNRQTGQAERHEGVAGIASLAGDQKAERSSGLVNSPALGKKKKKKKRQVKTTAAATKGNKNERRENRGIIMCDEGQEMKQMC